MLENLEKTELIELIHKLEKENKELKEKLYGFNQKSETIEENTKNNISNEEKVKLFMSIFKARTDANGTIWITSDGTTIEIEKLDINLNGNSKQAILLEDRKYSLIFYVKTLPFLSTTV